MYELSPITAEICKSIWSNDIKKMTPIFNSLSDSIPKEMSEKIAQVLNGDVTWVQKLFPKNDLNEENLEKASAELMIIYNLIQGEKIKNTETLHGIFK
jgi:hypothetical protein